MDINNSQKYDVVIAGQGAAAFVAGMYAARYVTKLYVAPPHAMQ